MSEALYYDDAAEKDAAERRSKFVVSLGVSWRHFAISFPKAKARVKKELTYGTQYIIRKPHFTLELFGGHLFKDGFMLSLEGCTKLHENTLLAESTKSSMIGKRRHG